MKQFRKSAFETNSSSSHSITIAKGEFIPDFIPVYNGIAKVYPGEFGWGVDTHNDAVTKASYAITWLKNVNSFPNNTKIINKLQWYYQLLEEVIKEETGADKVFFVPDATENHNQTELSFGYIDHQSIESNGGVGLKIFKNKETIKNFIFNQNSELVIDNDNH